MSESQDLPVFGNGVPVPYVATFSDEEYEKLQKGFKPRAMEEKWAVSFEEPYLHFRRSWTGLHVYRVKLTRAGPTIAVEEALWSSGLAKENPEQAAYQR